MTGPIVERVLGSSRYRDLDRGLVTRLASEELDRARNLDDAVKRVKRRLHQAVGAFRAGPRDGDPLSAVREAWTDDLTQRAFRDACRAAMARHASTAERLAVLDRFHAGIWRHTGVPGTIVDVGSGLHPLSLPWMGIADAPYLATDVDGRTVETVRDFLALVGQPHEARVADVIAEPPRDQADVALLLKLVPTLDRQDPDAATRLVRALRVRHAVVSFPSRSIGGRGKGMERTYRARLERLATDAGRVAAVAEASVPGELVFVLSLHG